MAGARIKVSGNFDNIEKFLKKASNDEIFRQLSSLGAKGVAALRASTPAESGSTAAQWSYEVGRQGKSWCIWWTNGAMAGDTPVIILLQYGHGTGTGGYVAGRDFINPSIRPVMDEIANSVWKAVTS